jgi:pimeloyl-ACP methyl ester carboxylesterase
MEPRLLAFDIPASDAGGASHRIACAEWGVAGDKPTVLCVHGLTRNGRDFDFVARALAADFHVLCPDMRGRGSSQWMTPADYANPAYLADIFFILKQVGISKLHWLGTSMGGILGLLAANSAPGLLQSLILNDIGCLIPASGLGRIKDIATIATVFGTRETAEAALRLRSATFGITEERHWQQLYTYGIEPVGDQWRFTYDPGIFTGGFAADAPVQDVELWPLWQAVTAMPMLLIRGALSDLLQADTAREMQARHPRLRLEEIAGVGHAPALMDDKQIALIHGWMSATVMSLP